MVFVFILLILAIVLLVFGIKTIMDQRSKKSPSSYTARNKEQKDYNEYKFGIAGVFYHEDDIWKMATHNYRYDFTFGDLVDLNIKDPIYKDQFPIIPATIVPEPDNPHSANALKVLANNIHVGYIRSQDNKKCRYLLSGALGMLVSCSATFKGGEFKQLIDKSDWDSDIREWKLINGCEDLTGTITIRIKPADPEDISLRTLSPNSIKLPK